MLTDSLSLTHRFFRSFSLTQWLIIHSPIHSLWLTHWLTRSAYALNLTHLLSLAHSHSPAHTLTPSLNLTDILTHSMTHSHSLTRTGWLSHPLTRSPCGWVCRSPCGRWWSSTCGILGNLLLPGPSAGPDSPAGRNRSRRCFAPGWSSPWGQEQHRPLTPPPAPPAPSPPPSPVHEAAVLEVLAVSSHL